MNEKKLSSKLEDAIWINAWYDPLASSCSFSQCMTLVDIFGEGNYKLVLGVSNANPLLRSNTVINDKQMEAKLRTFKGTTLLDEITLIDTPVAVVSYYPDNKAPKKPFIAVACNNAIFLYKNLQPFHRFLTPSTPVEEKEVEIWEQLKNSEIEIPKAMEELMALRDDGRLLTQRSQELISMMDENRINIFVERFKMRPLTPSTNSITCLAVLKKDREEFDSVGMLVVGCENKKIFILDPSGTKIVKEFTLPSVASILNVSGKYDIEYRIVIATRCGNVYSIRGGEVSGLVLEMDSHPVAVAQLERYIVVGTMARTVHFFGSKAKKQYSLYMPSDIKAIEVLDLRQSKNVKCIAIALEHNELRIYNGKTLVNIVQTVDTIVGLTFGTYGTEPNCLILNYRNGGLDFKILSRKANIENSKEGNGPPPEQDTPLNLPTKTNMYLELIAREKENPLEMHKVFQKDLYKLRVNTAKQYLKVISDGQGPISFINAFPIHLDVEIQGIGPQYYLKLSIQNNGNKPMLKIPLVLQYNAEVVNITPTSLIIPVLVHSLKYKFQFEVKCKELFVAEDHPIKLLVCTSEAASMTPALTYNIVIPAMERI